MKKMSGYQETTRAERDEMRKVYEQHVAEHEAKVAKMFRDGERERARLAGVVAFADCHVSVGDHAITGEITDEELKARLDLTREDYESELALYDERQRYDEAVWRAHGLEHGDIFGEDPRSSGDECPFHFRVIYEDRLNTDRLKTKLDGRGEDLGDMTLEDIANLDDGQRADLDRRVDEAMEEAKRRGIQVEITETGFSMRFR